MKIPVCRRLEKSLVDRAKELAEKNKKECRLPNNYSSVIEQALVEYLAKHEKEQPVKRGNYIHVRPR